ncbi:putative ABC exporter domain-containing protein [Corallococcus sp. M34]|uniref:putative ABC exporter domain-containing protein n=1 Tax=Citreicoccus inhibens TaxID=2849499 RepID=UPI001C22AB27|nr:putative ABC exporter domain-containing protein [Citreicoccus inhibens]MBU8899168.1 putative ABC exporter domain-containing protein [Citreicoccus inhibens]
MSLHGAVLFVWVRSGRNRVLRQLQRLKRPRYLVGALVGLAYLYSLVGRTLLLRDSAGSASPGVRLFAELSLVVSVWGTLFSAWALGADRPSLTFTETEVQQLFPAPVTRGALLHYKLARSVLGTAAGALAATLFVGRLVSAHPGLFFLGACLSLTTLSLHGTAASFMRTRWAARGGWVVFARWAVLALGLAGVGWVVLEALRAHPLPAGFASARQGRQWLLTFLDAPGPRAVLWPGRLLVGPALAKSTEDFLAALPPVLFLLVVHYAWVWWAQTPFEESALVRAEARERARAVRAPGRGAAMGGIRVGRQPFALRARGRPEVALIWKNLIARQRMGGGLIWLLITVVLGGTLAALLGDPTVLEDSRRVVSPVCLTMAVVMAVVGPSAFRMDLRMDLPKLELLRVLPLAGWQVVGAELAASALTLGAFQVALLAGALLLGREEDLGFEGAWVPALLGLMAFLPALSLAGLFVQNAAVVLLPAWVPVGMERARGIEALGQRLLTLAGTLVVTLVGLVPAAFVALVVGYPLFDRFGAWAFSVAGVVAAGVLAGEVALGIRWLGRVFQSLDLSEEQTE